MIIGNGGEASASNRRGRFLPLLLVLVLSGLAVVGCWTNRNQPDDGAPERSGRESTVGPDQDDELGLALDEIQTRLADVERSLRSLAASVDRLDATSSAKFRDLSDEIRTVWDIIDYTGYDQEPAEYGWRYAPVRDCSTRISFDYTPSTDDIDLGDVVFVGARSLVDEPNVSFDPTEDGRYAAHGIPVIVRNGVNALLVVPSDQQDFASLTYKAYRYFDSTRNSIGPFDVATGERAVRLDSCASSGGTTQFDGGLIVAGPRCVAIDVYVDGGTAPQTALIPFGANCP